MSNLADSKVLIAFICSTFSILCSGYQIIQHLINFHEPKFQLYIVRIILLVPIYSISSFLSLCLPESSLIFDTLRDWFIFNSFISSNRIYQKIALKLMFYIFLCNYLYSIWVGNTHWLLIWKWRYLFIVDFFKVKFFKKGRIKHPWPFTKKLRPLVLNRVFFRKIKQGCLQFVFIKPFTAIIALILESQHVYKEGSLELTSGYIYVAMINNVSVSVKSFCPKNHILI